MNFKVTREHIDKGGHSCNNCPVALAVKEEIDKITPGCHVSVLVYAINIGGGRYISPGEVVRFVLDYDARKLVAPFEFELEVAGVK